MDFNEFNKRYWRIWNRFGEDLSQMFAEIGHQATTAPSGELHRLLKKMYSVPYGEASGLLEIPVTDGKKPNIGSVTGLFFEQLIVSVVVPCIRAALPSARFERNSCSNQTVRDLVRDPDLFVSFGERIAVFEIKVSPKKRDLENLRERKSLFEGRGIGFFLIGGNVSANRDLLTSVNDGWATFLDSKQPNRDLLQQLPTVDALLERVIQHLTDSGPS